MITDPISDLLTRIRNAQLVGHSSVTIKGSRAAERVLEVLRSEGFIEGFKEQASEGMQRAISVELRYLPTGEPIISRLRRVSSPGRRTYSRCQDLRPIFRGLGISILSTSQGVMSDREARKRKIGGEVLANVG